MTKVQFARDLNAALKGAAAIRIVSRPGPFRTFSKNLEDERLEALRTSAVQGLEPGGVGRFERLHLVPTKLELMLLPERASRGLCPSGSDYVWDLHQTVGEKSCAIVVVVDDAADALPLLRSCARRFPEFDLRESALTPATLRLLAVTSNGEPIKLDRAQKALIEATRSAARLVDMPPTDLGPTRLAAEAAKLLGKKEGLKIRQIRGPALLKNKLGAIHGVGKAADDAPCLWIAQSGVGGGGRKKSPHVAIVGKGITYDTGGLHLKGRGSMEGMKGDMGGAAAAIGAFQALVASGHKGPVSVLLALAENAIGPAALKPDDIVTMHSGRTVEINNTDAEGRLVVGDAVSYAARVLGADIVLDIATLTGAQLVATGKTFAAVVTDDPELEALAGEAGRAVGDPVHPLPYAPELHKLEFQSPIADMRNSVADRGNAQSSCAGYFIGCQIEDTDARWCHFDIAGPAARQDRGTGAGVGVLAEMVRRLH